MVEVLIVVVIMAILAATIIPQFASSSKDAKESTAQFNLSTLRSQLELYKSQHNGEYAPTLADLTKKTNANHTSTGTPTLGQYILSIPTDSVTGSNAVATSTANPIGGTITGTTGGWIYNSTTGEIRINHKDYDDF